VVIFTHGEEDAGIETFNIVCENVEWVHLTQNNAQK
jgi:hypothetical protein